ncbi:MAG TPA: hypothetical protein VGI10_28675 [Polyangiaceae bacterium]|jgi:predicted nucleic-acid-binding Zn-ribbon protein
MSNIEAPVTVWLREKQQDHCDRCGSKKYVVGSTATLMPVPATSEQLSTQPTVIPVTCQNCGDVKLLSADVLEL